MHVVGGGGGEEEHGACDVRGRSPSSGRDPLEDLAGAGGSSWSAWVLSVAMYPGATALTLTPRAAHSFAKAFVSCAIATLAGRVAGNGDPALEGEERGDEHDLPPAALQHGRPISRVSTNWAVRFTSRTVVPVLVTVLGRRVSTDRSGVVDEHVDRRPCSQSSAAGVERSPISEIGTRARGRSTPRCLDLAADIAPVGLEVALTPITSAPASANAIEIASPMPRRQPVTSTVDPENEPAVMPDSRPGSSWSGDRRPVRAKIGGQPLERLDRADHDGRAAASPEASSSIALS